MEPSQSSAALPKGPKPEPKNFYGKVGKFKIRTNVLI